MSVLKVPFSLSDVIIDASFLRDLTKDQGLVDAWFGPRYIMYFTLVFPA